MNGTELSYIDNIYQYTKPISNFILNYDKRDIYPKFKNKVRRSSLTNPEIIN